MEEDVGRDELPPPPPIDAAGGLLLVDRGGQETLINFAREAEAMAEVYKGSLQRKLSGLDPDAAQKAHEPGSSMSPDVLAALGLEECAIPGGSVRVLSPVRRKPRRMGRLEQVRLAQRLNIAFPRGRDAQAFVHPRDQVRRRKAQ